MNRQRVGKALQHFQMYVWLYGYQKGDIKGHVFPDVSKAFHKWHNFLNIKIYLYSSGVYLTQKLLFSCSLNGNLTPLIEDFLDVESYGPKTIKLNAAKAVGYAVLLALRPLNKELSDEEKQGFQSIESFEEISFT
ncbi:unnamed protein product [Oppiella nova]|uniref:Uncharacterized protein n=1 Tax=Oppiella nova TaxID=334625 RepID=A0A7R9QXW9_9ACAR|nr:unnamed protein product [Oppiella nova]CAG2179651.1 unnamed protein product [Oppiella nova]